MDMDTCKSCKYWDADRDVWFCIKNHTCGPDANHDCEDFELAEEVENDENVVSRLTEAFILYDLLSGDMGLDVGGWKPWLWESICNEFMNRLEKAGYISKTENNE